MDSLGKRAIPLRQPVPRAAGGTSCALGKAALRGVKEAAVVRPDHCDPLASEQGNEVVDRPFGK
jgi:hypothetical protein